MLAEDQGFIVEAYELDAAVFTVLCALSMAHHVYAPIRLAMICNGCGHHTCTATSLLSKSHPRHFQLFSLLRNLPRRVFTSDSDASL